MKTDAAKKHARPGLQEQMQNAKNTRITLKELQSSALDKENLVGRSRIDKDHKLIEKIEKPKKVAHKGIQTGEAVITAEDLTSDEPGIDYWKTLAETRGNALNDSLQEIDKLREQNEILEQTTKNLQEENRICKEMLDESRNLVEILQEMLAETEEANELNQTELAEEATED